MKLKRFKEKDNKRIGIILFTITGILLVSGVILYRTFAIFEVRTNQNVIKGNVQDPGDIYFAFYQKNEETGEYEIKKEMPQKGEGYDLDKENSYCGVNGNKDDNIFPTLNRDTWSIVVTGMKTSRTKCNLYFKKTYNDTTLYDLSNNHFNGTFINGAKIQKDDNGNLGIYFDGTDDYVDIVDLPETINWEGGFTIEFDAMWNSFNHYSRILDFSNGTYADNIFVSNFEKTNLLVFETVYNRTDYRKPSADVTITLNQRSHYKIEYIKTTSGNEVVITIDNKSPHRFSFEVQTVQNITRTENYLGLSAWVNKPDGYFHGYIYSLKITDANDNIILLYDL